MVLTVLSIVAGGGRDGRITSVDSTPNGISGWATSRLDEQKQGAQGLAHEIAAAGLWVVSGSMDVGATTLPLPDPTRTLGMVQPTPGVQRVVGTTDDEQWSAFRRGYEDFGGRLDWEDRFVHLIDTCESQGHAWSDDYSYYISRAQFAPGSWATATAATGLTDPHDPYHVGANVAWWSNAIASPGGSGGWPVCWWR